MSQHSESGRRLSPKQLAALTLGALGVVYGDIGTSPLYALKECFHHSSGILPTPQNVLGVVSLVLWALIGIVSIKYLTFVLRADNRGEGGVLALTALALRGIGRHSAKKRNAVVLMGLTGSALLYGDGIITPAISVMSAVEGLTLVTTAFDPYVTSITVVVLIGLFAIQKNGTGQVGILFGPIILVWFLFLGVLGLPSIVQTPQVLKALNPWLAFEFFFRNGSLAFVVLGAVFLSVTGTEALYADMGHFGKKPIQIGWFSVAFPALILNYLGQGALLLRDPAAVEHPFFRMVPEWCLVPAVILATLATVIASQALISGAYSLTNQAIQLGYLPRLSIRHTSDEEFGQIYIPLVNWALLSGCLVLVFAFPSSSSLASAYGIAVATTMVITTCLIFVVAQDIWKWKGALLYGLIGTYLCVDLAFFSANVLKLFHGGYVPVGIAIALVTIMTTWCTGRRLLWLRLLEQVPLFKEFVEELASRKPFRIPGTAVFMIRDLNIAPPALIFNVRHNKVLHERNILLTIIPAEVPWWDDDATRVHVEDIGNGFVRCIVQHGFMENIDVPATIRNSLGKGLIGTGEEVTYFLDRVLPIPTSLPGMAIWRERLFAFMTQNSLRATKFYRIPAKQVIEIGFQIEI